MKTYGKISPELQNSEKALLAFTFKCLLGVVEAHMSIHTCILKPTVNELISWDFQPFETTDFVQKSAFLQLSQVFPL